MKYDVEKYDIKIDGEPEIVTQIRHKILHTFKDLEFVEEGHHYYLFGEEIESVTTVVKQFENEADFDLIAEKKALREGIDKQTLLDEWKFNNLRATTTGTLVHEFGESLGWLKSGHQELITDSCKMKYVQDKNWLIPTRPKEEAIIKFMNEEIILAHIVEINIVLGIFVWLSIQ